MPALLANILELVASKLLSLLAADAFRAIQKYEARLKQENVDDKNVKQYAMAKARANKIKAAVDLLNGTKPN